MSAKVGVPVNEGVSVEHDDPEINSVIQKMKESFPKNASVTKLPGLTSNTTSNNSHDESIDFDDSESLKGRFGWKEIGISVVPYIIRVINDEYLRYVSVRIVESQLPNKYFNYLHADIYKCPSVKSYFITENEAKLLNEINIIFCDQTYGKELFQAGKDYIVRLEDVQEFFAFTELCYNKLLYNNILSCKEKCGFIRILTKNHETIILAYCINDNKKYVPLDFLNGKTEHLMRNTVKIENWDLAYLRFYCMISNIGNDTLFHKDSYIGTSLNEMKFYFPPQTIFEEYWPAYTSIHFINFKPGHINLSGAWIRAPPTVMN